MIYVNRFVIKLLNSLGYQILRIKTPVSELKDDLDLYYKYFSEFSIKQRRFYNIGAGSFSHPAWTNVDKKSDWYATNKNKIINGISYDLESLRPLPIESDSAEIVYTSHVVEHITDRAAQNLFNESFRILKARGIFRVSTTNIDLDFRAWKDNDMDYFYWRKNYFPRIVNGVKINKSMENASIEQLFLHHFASTISTTHLVGKQKKMSDNEIKKIFSEKDFESALNYCTSLCPPEEHEKYPGLHRNWWNKDKMSKMLKKAGFNKIYLSGYGQSFSHVLRNTRYFDNTRPPISLYVEAIK